MPQIFIHTPNYKWSDYIAHLLEHILLWERKNAHDYFVWKNISWENYTYYTSYDIKDENDTETFFQHILSPLNASLIPYEKKVLKSEYSQKRYFQNLISKIGKKLYWKEYSYSQNKNFSKSEIINYHQKYYKKTNIITLPKDLKTKDIILEKLSFSHIFDISLQWEKEKVFVAKYSHQNIFIMEVLGQLLDNFFHYQTRYLWWWYYYNETLSWEFEDFVFISIDIKNLWFLKNISQEFIHQFTNIFLSHWEDQDFSSIDGPLMLKYSFSLSDVSKKEILKNIWEYIYAVQWAIS